MSVSGFESKSEAPLEPPMPTAAGPEAEPTPPGAARWGALAFTEYRSFFIGTAFSNVGLWMQQFAVGWLAVQLAEGDGHPDLAPFYVGLMSAARIVPGIVVGLAAGVIADRFDRRLLLQATRGGMALLIAVIAGLTLSGVMTIYILFGLTILTAMVGTLDGPARLSLSPMLVPARYAFNAMSLTRAFMQLASLVGPLIGGMLVVPLGVGGVMVVNAALYVFSGLGMGRLSALPPLAKSGNPLESFMQGVTFVRHEPTIRAYITGSALLVLLGGSVTQIMPNIAYNLLKSGAVELSYLLTALGFGALIGSIVTTGMNKWARPGLALVGMAFATGAAVLGLGFQSTLIPALVLVAVHGIVMQVYGGGVGNIVQLLSPNEVRGRVTGIWMLNFGVGQQIGTIILGTLGSLIGLSNALLIAGGGVLLISIGMLRTKEIRNLSQDVLRRG